MNHLSPNINKNQWTLEDDLKFIALLKQNGRNWKIISAEMNGRSVTQLKNRYLGRIKRLAKAKNAHRIHS